MFRVSVGFSIQGQGSWFGFWVGSSGCFQVLTCLSWLAEILLCTIKIRIEDFGACVRLVGLVGTIVVCIVIVVVCL